MKAVIRCPSLYWPWGIKALALHDNITFHSGRLNFPHSPLLFYSFFSPFQPSTLFSAAETKALFVLQNQEHPQQERRQLLPNQQRQQDGAAVRRQQQHGPSLQHRDGPAAHHQPPHPSGPSSHPLRSSSHVALPVTQPTAGRLGRALLHGAHLQEAHVL